MCSTSHYWTRFSEYTLHNKRIPYVFVPNKMPHICAVGCIFIVHLWRSLLHKIKRKYKYNTSFISIHANDQPFGRKHTITGKWKWITQWVPKSSVVWLKYTSYQQQLLIEMNWMSIYSWRPSDAIWQHRSVSTLAQVMACCLTAPSHYLNQGWFIISKV